jgi:hypothetical protein
MSSIDLNDPVAVLVAAFHALEQAGIEAATYIELIERELDVLAVEIPDHEVMARWQRAQSKLSSGSETSFT